MTALRVLLVENDSAAAESLAAEVGRGHGELNVRRVDSEPDLRGALKDFGPDVILSAHSTPDLKGARVLSIVNELAPGVPLVIVADPGDEEAAVECLRDGAADYVLSDRLARLPQAVAGALERSRPRAGQHWAQPSPNRSDALLRAFVAANVDGVFVKDPTLHTIMANRAYAAIVGRPLSELLGSTDPEIMTESMAASCRVSDLEALRHDAFVVTEEVVSGRVFETRKFPVSLMDGSTGVGGYVRDITERKHADQALRESQERLSLALESAGLGLWDSDVEKGALTLSERWAAIIGHTLEEIEGEQHPWRDRVHPDDLAEALAQLERHLDGETPFYESEHRLRTRSGEWIWVQDRGRVIERAPDGKPRRLIGAHRDISARRRAEEALRESEAQWRAMFELASIGIAQADPATGRFTRANRKMAEITGYGEDELLTMRVADLTHPDDRQKDWELFQRVVRGELPDYRIEMRYVRKDGTVRWVNINMTVIRDASGDVVRTIAAIEDIDDRKRAEHALRETEARFRALIEGAPVAIGVGKDGASHYANPAFLQLFGFSSVDDIVGTPITDYFAPEVRATIADHAGRRSRGLPSPSSYETIGQRTDGSRFPAQVSVTTVELSEGLLSVAFITDLSARKEAEAQLRQAQKMEAVGRLAGGVAHDFNNLLQVMLGVMQLLGIQHGGDPGVKSSVEEMSQLIKRATGLTRQLLLFARRSAARPERCDLNDIVRGAVTMLRRLVRANVRLAVEESPGTLAIVADPGQIEQVLMNLVVNAVDAMPGGGTLTIRTGDEHETVWFEVADTGSGIPDEMRDKIFDPFFTTKEAGRGTGLGLSVVHGTVTEHGGRIKLTTEVGKGTTFRIELPAAAPDELTKTIASSAGIAGGGRGERLLVVEDNATVRGLIQTVLTRLGYAVEVVGSSEEADALPEAPAFDLLLTDVMLPGASGVAAAQGLVERWPALKVVLMSGYAEDEVLREDVSVGKVRFLQKPIGFDALAREIRAALDDRPA